MTTLLSGLKRADHRHVRSGRLVCAEESCRVRSHITSAPFVVEKVIAYVIPDARARSTTSIRAEIRQDVSLAICFSGFTVGLLMLLDRAM